MQQIFKPEEWFSNVRGDFLAGAVVALALIPEAIAFSIIAGVDPKVGLYASFTIAVITSFLGGRPAMISAATGATALLMTHLVGDHENGLQYLFAATILTGVLQLIWGFIKVGNQIKFVSRAVMIGFVNALAILIFMAQLPQFENASWVVYAMVAGGLAIIYLLPRFTKAVPSPLVAIIIITLISLAMGSPVATVGDMGELPTTLPSFGLPEVPLNFETLQIIFPTAFALSMVGLLESFLTANVVDELTDTSSDKNQEAKAQGIANFVTGFFGGMAGCAMIGQSVINVQSGGRTRLSTLSAGFLLIFFMLVVTKWVEVIPMAALVAVMIMVSIGTFSWGSLRNIKKIPRSETAVMLTTVVITVFSHNLAMGVVAGIALNAVLFARKLADLVFVDSLLSADGNHRIYSVAGQIFFVSVNHFLKAFDFQEDLESVKIDLTHAHLWDQSAIAAIDKVVLNFRRKGAEVNLVGLNEASATLIDKLAVHDKAGELHDLTSH
ncbi:sulfate permease-like transporter, MFS superfamily [Xenococcus sp. PCC 7305]|uniref:SulP family inorganic anion transporter n=1 Tax=Xenococcus sp. PCC 7305 TaxID=102125 RepID=UPI0002ACD0FA|nr:SulP family inorganic anion transporter [Xenococcus sp. PCC 7305]ELS03705.1 sulfate permease-like transporter, MFS superfamily [Xenococcus sp. PCC 7305]